jgi:hypothetical protein
VSGGYTRYADAPALDVTTPDFRFLSPRIFDDDDTTALLSGDIYEDVAGTQPYRVQGVERADRLT